MRRVKFLAIAIVAIVLLGLAVAPTYAQAQDVVVAEVDRNDITTDDILNLTVAIDSSLGDPSQPVLPVLDGFEVLGTSRGTQMTIINGDMSMQTTYRYSLRPVARGDFVIEPISVSSNGNVYYTAPIAVRVSQGTGLPSQPNSPLSLFPSLSNFPGLSNFPSLGNLPTLPNQPTSPSAPSLVPVDPAPAPMELSGQDFFVEAVVDNPNPFQGQQINYAIRFYQAINAPGQIEYEPPTFTGFWAKQVPEQGEYNIQAAGRNYHVTELKTILFPTIVGDVTIEPTSMGIPGDFFSRSMNLRSQPVLLDVQPLPDGAPASFAGAVGNYDIQAAVDVPTTVVNDTITWQVAVTGEGNIDNLADPLWPESSEWRAFDSEAVVDSRIEDGKVVGSRQYDRVVVPTIAGNIALPPIEFSYFNPDMGQYQTVSTEPIAITVESDGDDNIAVPPSPAINDNANAAATGIGPDILGMKDAPAKWHLASKPLIQQNGFWLLWTIPILVLAGHFGWQSWQRKRFDNTDSRRSQKAARNAQQALSAARKNSDGAYEAAGQILTTYLSQKLNQSVVGLTQTSLAQLLREKGVVPGLVDRVQNCLMLSEMGRYAPANADIASGDILVETKQIINELERSL